MNIDIHAHILPELDDNSNTLEASIELLKKEVKDDIDIVIAAPVFDATKQTVEEFLEARDKSYTKLVTEIGFMEIPTIKLGAEVKFIRNLKQLPDLHQLCIEGTDYLLLKLPEVQLNKEITNDIYDLTYTTNIKPIIVNVENSLKYTSIESLEEILDMDVLGQVNAASFIDKEVRKLVFRLVNNNYVHLLGSNAYNPINKPVLMKEAENIIVKKFSKRLYLDLMQNATMVLKNSKIDDILL
ncbi:MAG: hypothetical protein E7262_08680 [Lachnospiraceae bacterium]|nr:hypothetical protein [Lachnospiraceae bacterium]